MDIIVKRAETPDEVAGAVEVRRRVFVEEQGVSLEEEMDGLDEGAVHAVTLEDGRVVATGRLLLRSATLGQVGRMAVLHDRRRKGVGGRILRLLEEEARARGLRRIELHAQTYVTAFYARHGYQQQGQPFVEAGIQHITMTKEL